MHRRIVARTTPSAWVRPFFFSSLIESLFPQPTSRYGGRQEIASANPGKQILQLPRFGTTIPGVQSHGSTR